MRDVHEARLLIVDDEPELRRMLVSILRGDGYADVHEAATAAEAMEKALRLRPDALILDVMLPDGDGFFAFPGSADLYAGAGPVPLGARRG